MRERERERDRGNERDAEREEMREGAYKKVRERWMESQETEREGRNASES